MDIFFIDCRGDCRWELDVRFRRYISRVMQENIQTEYIKFQKVIEAISVNEYNINICACGITNIIMVR